MTTDARTPPANAPRTWDFLLTVLFVLIQVLLAVALLISAFSFGAINTECAGCNVTAVRIGQALCTFSPPLIAVVSIPWAIARVLRRRIGFWVSLLGAALMVGVFFLGTTLMAMGVPTVG